MLKAVVVAGVLMVVAYVLVISAAIVFLAVGPQAWRAAIKEYQGLASAPVIGLSALLAFLGALGTIAVQTDNVDRQLKAQRNQIEADRNDRRTAIARALINDVQYAIQPTYVLQQDLGDPTKLNIPPEDNARVAFLKEYQVDIPPRLFDDPLQLGLLSGFAQSLIDQLVGRMRRYDTAIMASHNVVDLRGELTDATMIQTAATTLVQELLRLAPAAEPTNDEILARLKAPLQLVTKYDKAWMRTILNKRGKDVDFDKDGNPVGIIDLPAGAKPLPHDWGRRPS